MSIFKDEAGLTFRATSSETLDAYQEWVSNILGYGKKMDLILKINDDKCVLTNSLSAILLQSVEEIVPNLENLLDQYLSKVSKQILEIAEPREKHYYEIAKTMRTHQSGSETRRMWWELLEQWPQDIIACKFLQGIYFNRGETKEMLRVADKVWPSLKNNHFMHGIKSWALIELGRIEEGEILAREGTKMAPNSKDPWCHHCVVHCLHVKGDFNQGISWMEGLSDRWNDCHSFMYTHNWWHTSLLHMELNQMKHANELFDKNIWGINKNEVQDQVGAVSYLWRCDIRKSETSISTWEDIASHMRPHARDHMQPFLDLHYIYGFAKARDEERLSECMESLEQTRNYEPNVKKITLALGNFLTRYCKGDFEGAFQNYDEYTRDNLKLVGGSNVQLESFEESFVDVLIQTGRYEAALPWLRKQNQERPFVKDCLKKVLSNISG